MCKLRKYVVKNEFKRYIPERTDFEIVQETIPPLKTGEFLVKTEYISVDPYMRSFADDCTVPYDQFDFQVGKVINTKNSDYPINTYVVSHAGWRDYAVLNDEQDDMFDISPYQPQIGNLRISHAIGALGMPGVTAYLGLTEICDPKKGEVVCITSAAGAVGSLVGQIAKIKGCTVIGLTGCDHKVQILLQELGFDHAFNYKKCNIKKVLSSTVKGIDCFFDNGGGCLSDAVVECMNEYGRIAICGSISTYGKTSSQRKKLKPPVSVKVESFSFTQWNQTKRCEASNKMREWMEKGLVKAKETVANGFQELPDTLAAMLRAEYVGKAVVKI